MNRILRLLSYLSSFLIARGLLFGSPLLLASTLPAESYAQIEWALASATLAATVLTLGCGGLVPIVAIGENSTRSSLRGIRWHHLIIATVTLVATLLLYLTTHQAHLWQLPLLVGVLALTTLKSTELKTNKLANASLFVDALLLVAMAGLAFLSSKLPQGIINPWMAPIALITLFGVMLVRDLHSQWSLPGLSAEWVRTMRAGIPLMLTGALATLITTSGRTGVGSLLSPLAAADYSVLTRGAALPIVAHQIFVVAVFPQLFATTPRALNRLLVAIIGLVTASALLLWLLLPAFGHLLGSAFANASAVHANSLLLLLAQAILWSGIALNDTINARNGTSGAVLRWSIPALLLIFILSWWVFSVGQASLERFVLTHSVAMFCFFTCQTWTMWRHGVRTLPMAMLACTAFLSIFIFVQLS